MKLRHWSWLFVIAGLVIQLAVIGLSSWIMARAEDDNTRDLAAVRLAKIVDDAHSELIGNSIVGHFDIQQRLIDDLARRHGIGVTYRFDAVQLASQPTVARDGALETNVDLEYAGRSYGHLSVWTPLDSFLAKNRSLLLITFLCQTGAMLVVVAMLAFNSRVLLRPFAALAQAPQVADAPQRSWLVPSEVLALRAQLIDRELLARKNERLEAVTRTTQMLAHDVRKPFSILRMGLGMLGNAKDPASVKNILGRLVPEIDKAVSSVDGLIADVMEVGSTSTELIKEPANPESLIEATLGEIFRVYPKAEIRIGFDLKHTHMVNVHVQKVGRVFSNIIGNALQAMGYKGNIWFKTSERNGFIEFCLGNSGSVISQESLPKLFDAFFTSGKKDGTGLGLAIAEKVVTAHGGRIWCESSKTLEYPDGKVEFFFTLPVADGRRCKSTTVLPRHSSEITMALQAIAASNDGDGQSVDKGELALEADIVQAREHIGHPLRILVVDDEPIYRNALASYLSRTPELVQSLSVVLASDSEEALKAAAGQVFDLVITDVDMGPASLDGFELVRELKTRRMRALVCVHSNRIVGADHQTAIEAGAEAFLPKPMARAQLLRLVLQAGERGKWNAMAAPAIAVPPRQVAIFGAKPRVEVLVIDDNPFILDAWENVLSTEATVHLITSLEGLQAKLAEKPTFLDRLSYVVTDMHLDGSAGDGLDVGRLIKGLRSSLPILLSSDGVFTADELTGSVDAVIGKDPVGLAGLASWV